MLFFAVTANAQVIRPFSVRYYNPSVRGNIVYVSNSIVTTAGVAAGSPGTGEVPPAGTTRNNVGNGVYIDVDNPAPTIKLPFGSKWDYHGNNAAPPNDGGGDSWKVTPYTLTGPWNVNASPVGGSGKYGYASGQATCMPSGRTPICTPSAGNKYTAYYFRKAVTFTAAELSTTFYSIQMDLLRNDGIVVYVNGVERIRDNIGAGTVTYNTLATNDIAVGAAEAVTYQLSPSFFTAGTNTIAVEVHLKATNSTNMSFDMQVSGLDNGGTFSSSTADLTLPTCSQVLFAGLYWGADRGSSGTDSIWQSTGAFNQIKLKIPGSATYTTLTSTQTDKASNAYSVGLGHTGYFCFKDITSIINTLSPNGTYTAADVVAPSGILNASAGWTIVIAYTNAILQPRNLTIFDGNVIINLGDPAVDVPITGFLTPPTPAAVSCEVGTVVYDGDRSGLDSFSFKQVGAGAFYNLATTTVPLNGAQDAFNSKISYKGTVTTTRNPAFNNTLGYDASIFDLPNGSNAQLGNSKTSATVRFASPSENYFVQVVSTSISQYNPAFSFTKAVTDLNGGSVQPGDSLRYVITYNNVGNDASNNTVIIDDIPLGSSFKPASLRIAAATKTDAVADDQAEYDVTNNRVLFRIGTGANGTVGGNVPNTGAAATGTVQFDVIVTPSCSVLSCVGTINNKARISYTGATSGHALVDTSGVNVAGCVIAPYAVTMTPAGSCYIPRDTLIINSCPTLTGMIPYVKYAGYQIYSAMPFIPANTYNPSIPVSVSHVYWAYFNNGPGCSDTIKINMIIDPCPDIDDDNDGIPDYVEFNDPRALTDLLPAPNGKPDWNDPAYPGYVDYNLDLVNDLFDWGADANNNGIPNFRDASFWITWVDVNGDGINDKCDRDLDGIPNQYDRDSDNDGVPDVAESYGVDTNGDGIIDNYADTDNDGFTQTTVDANNTGVNLSGNGLGAQDLDLDGVPNYLDADSDNDGIPDVVEALGADVNNDGAIDAFLDNDGNGISDAVQGAVLGLFLTGPDTSPVNGRADNWPNKDMDKDGRPNMWDLDTDGDGITDVKEAGFTDAIPVDGIIDGSKGLTTGWSTSISAQPALGLFNTDGIGNPDFMDIDADGDGIPDNIEGQTTAGYKLPAAADSDNDGIDNNYEVASGSFGGTGVALSDKDGDNLPDYRDLDTDSDGVLDIVEGNDFNLNGIADDNVTPTGLDTDFDGLDNRFDSLTSTTNIKGTSYRMGTSGSFTGDAAPGGRSPVQRTLAMQPDRDWRYVGYVLPVQLIEFSGASQISNVVLNWSIITPLNIDRFEIERSTDNMMYEKVGSVAGNVSLNELHKFTANDNISNIKTSVIYYRLKIIATNGQVKFSNVLLIRKNINKTEVTVQPNPASNSTSIHFYADKESEVTIRLIDAVGKTVIYKKQKVTKGNNVLQLNELSQLNNAVYSVQIVINDEIVTKKLIVQNR